MEGNRKHLLDRFQEHLGERYITWCERHGFQKSDDRLVTFLIDQDLIPATLIQRYAVLREFDKLSKEPSFHKTHTVNTLAHRFNISERTVWSILKHGRTGNGNKRV
ncbi:MAG: hypothetical protein GC192_21480 [Bacteroidetes bacterium]|nr:hypothetical protein [Bacteroidota bacterium]